MGKTSKIAALLLAIIMVGTTSISFADTSSIVKYTIEDFDPINVGNKYYSIGEFNSGVAFYTIDTDNDGRADVMGLIDINGIEITEPIFECRFNVPGKFENGLARVEKDFRVGYINTKGEFIIPCEYYSSYGFSEGLTAVEKDGKAGFLDTTGKIVIPLQYDKTENFSEGLAAVGNIDKYYSREKFGYIDKTGKMVIPIQYDDITKFSNGYAMVGKRIGDEWRFEHSIIDKTGKEIVPFSEDESNIYKLYKELTEAEDKIGYTTTEKDGMVYEHYDDYIIRKTKVTSNTGGNVGDFTYYKDYTYLDKNGNQINSILYKNGSPFSFGFARVSSGNERKGSGIIDKYGNEVIWADGGMTSFDSEGRAIMTKLNGEKIILTSPLITEKNRKQTK